MCCFTPAKEVVFLPVFGLIVCVGVSNIMEKIEDEKIRWWDPVYRLYVDMEVAIGFQKLFQCGSAERCINPDSH